MDSIVADTRSICAGAAFLEVRLLCLARKVTFWRGRRHAMTEIRQQLREDTLKMEAAWQQVSRYCYPIRYLLRHRRY